MCSNTHLASTMWLQHGSEELCFLCPRSVSASYRRLYNCMCYPEINCITQIPRCPLSHAYTTALDLSFSVDTSPSCYTEPSAINHMSMHTWLGTLRILFLCTAVQVNMHILVYMCLYLCLCLCLCLHLRLIQCLHFCLDRCRCRCRCSCLFRI